MKGGKEGCNITQVTSVKNQKDGGEHKYLIRNLLQPQSGLLLAADARQIQFRIFVHYSGNEKLIETYRANPDTDYHDIVVDMVKQFMPSAERPRVKILNLALLFGAGGKQTADLMEMPRADADAFTKVYHRAFPDVRRMTKAAEQLAKSRGYVKTLSGRRIRFPKGEFTYKALNAAIQGSEADLIKMKSVELHRERKRTGFKMHIINHDEFVGTIQDAEGAERVKMLLMEPSRPDLRVPITWSIKLGPSWGEVK